MPPSPRPDPPPRDATARRTAPSPAGGRVEDARQPAHARRGSRAARVLQQRLSRSRRPPQGDRGPRDRCARMGRRQRCIAPRERALQRAPRARGRDRGVRRATAGAAVLDRIHGEPRGRRHAARARRSRVRGPAQPRLVARCRARKWRAVLALPAQRRRRAALAARARRRFAGDGRHRWRLQHGRRRGPAARAGERLPGTRRVALRRRRPRPGGAWRRAVEAISRSRQLSVRRTRYRS